MLLLYLVPLVIVSLGHCCPAGNISCMLHMSTSGMLSIPGKQKAQIAALLSLVKYTCAGQDKITNASQPTHGQGVRAVGYCKPCHFHEAARDQRCPAVVAEA